MGLLVFIHMNHIQRKRAEALLENMPNPPDIVLAAYIPRDDVIVMPYFADKNEAEYYCLLLEEISHSSGHPSRLGRYTIDGDGKFHSTVVSDDQTEILEELTSTISSAILASHIHVINLTCKWHQDMISHYIDEAKDKCLLSLAIKQAEAASSHISNQELTIAILPQSIKQLLSV